MDRQSRRSRSVSREDTDEQILWKKICSALVGLEGTQQQISSVIDDINKTRSAAPMEYDEQTVARLTKRYQRGIDLSSSEEKTITDIIENLSALIALLEASEDQKRRKRKNDEDRSSASTALDVPAKKTRSNGAAILSPGASVAAQQPKDKDKGGEWFLAIVLAFHGDKNKYYVEDVDQDESGKKSRYMLSPRNVIPVRDASAAKQLPEISAGRDVLALYPETTCFYKAKIIAAPSKTKDKRNAGNYKVQFEDDDSQFRYVAPIHVLEMPKAGK